MSCLSVNGWCKLTSDAELRKSKAGAWLHFGIATFRSNPQAGRQDCDMFHAEYFMKNPESGLNKELVKGRIIYLDRAEVRNDKFMGRDGKEKSFWKIVIRSFDFLDRFEAPPEKEEPKFAAAPDEEEVPF